MTTAWTCTDWGDNWMAKGTVHREGGDTTRSVVVFACCMENCVDEEKVFDWTILGCNWTRREIRRDVVTSEG